MSDDRDRPGPDPHPGPGPHPTPHPQPDPQPDARRPAPEAQTVPEPVPLTEEEMRAKTQGAQVVLPPDSPAAIAAKGGAGTTINENTAARDAALIEEGLDPNAPSAELTDKPAA
jgi:hypothetical protein